jgi:GT2 family glycosyltransferase
VDVGRPSIRTSVVLPVYRPGVVLDDVLAALGPQLADGTREAILVESTGDGTAERLRDRYPWLQVIALPERTPQGLARNIGAARARGELLAFLDADAVPASDWLDRLEAGLADGLAAVCGAVENGTPRSAVGTAGYLLEFAEWMPSRRGAPAHGATCNLLVRRDAFERAGGFAEDVWTGEDTLLTVELARAGGLAFAREARVAHMNRTALAGLLRDQRKHGVGSAQLRTRVDFPHGWASRPLLAPVALGVKTLGVLRACAGDPRALLQLARVSPVAALGLGAWTAGVVRSGRYGSLRPPS